LDPLSGYLLLARRLIENPQRFSDAWNFGPVMSDQITVRELAERFVSAWGAGKIKTPKKKRNAPHEAHVLHLNIDKAVFDLDWSPVLDSATAIDWTVQWYKSWHDGNMDLRKLSLKQICQYALIADRRPGKK
jgi:CDP-glucose 4,6-dehydratase